MSLECSECEHDLRGEHDEDCSRHSSNVIKKLREERAALEAKVKRLEDALTEVKYKCLTMTPDTTSKDLARIIRICIDAGITKKLPELEAERKTAAALEGE